MPDNLIILLRSLYSQQQACVRTADGETERFNIGKGVRQGCILSPCLFTMYNQRIMRDADLDDAGLDIRISGRIINNLRYADDATLLTRDECVNT